jgi:hypothetical protein
MSDLAACSNDGTATVGVRKFIPEFLKNAGINGLR